MKASRITHACRLCIRAALPTVHPSSTAQAAAATCDQHELRLVIYHRALNRRPGGNTQERVVRHAYGQHYSRPERARKARRANAVVTVTAYQNDDGTVSLPGRPATIVPAAERVAAAVLPALATLLRHGGGATLFESTINDDAVDTDAYDTEWSSIELLLYDLPGRLLCRAFQRALRPRFRRDGDSEGDVRPASAGLIGLWSSVASALRLGRVEPFCDGTTAGSREMPSTYGQRELPESIRPWVKAPLYLADERGEA